MNYELRLYKKDSLDCYTENKVDSHNNSHFLKSLSERNANTLNHLNYKDAHCYSIASTYLSSKQKNQN